ncbi:MAG: hypothetical protein WD906_00530 [Anaerolineales bacterium]
MAPAGTSGSNLPSPPHLSKGAPPAEQAHEYLERVQTKINRLAEEFATGKINRSQFQELFDHYQRERRTVETWMLNASGSESWKKAAQEGQSVVIRTAHMARVMGYSIYENESGIPINTIGQFEIDSALAVPMLSSYRSAAKEIFGAELRSTQIEGGRWLAFVPGEITTLMALFSNEPAQNQLSGLEDLHRLFERANRHLLQSSPIDSEALVFPHVSFVGHTV